MRNRQTDNAPAARDARRTRVAPASAADAAALARYTIPADVRAALAFYAPSADDAAALLAEYAAAPVAPAGLTLAVDDAGNVTARHAAAGEAS
jgi:hypothetical protein